jgi:hypothetical protein
LLFLGGGHVETFFFFLFAAGVEGPGSDGAATFEGGGEGAVGWWEAEPRVTSNLYLNCAEAQGEVVDEPVEEEVVY